MLYDYYNILDIPRTAGLNDIKKAYRSKAKLVHPDINKSEKANEIFIIVGEAYDILTDENKRYLYDIKLNYIDSEKQNAERKKHYYGSSVKNDSFTSASNGAFQNEYTNFSKYSYKEKTDADYYKKSPFLYNMFFACGMLLGFIIIIVTITGTLKNYWPFPFVLISITGGILVKEGWKGIMGKKTILSRTVKWFRK